MDLCVGHVNPEIRKKTQDFAAKNKKLLESYVGIYTSKKDIQNMITLIGKYSFKDSQ